MQSGGHFMIKSDKLKTEATQNQKKSQTFGDPRYIAWAIWTLLANNPVSSTVYQILCISDIAILCIYSLSIVHRLQESNLGQNSNDSELTDNLETSPQVQQQPLDTDNQSILTDTLSNLDHGFHSLKSDNPNLMLILCSVVLTLNIMVLSSISFISNQIKKQNRSNQQVSEPSQSVIYSIISLIMILLNTTFSTIFLDVGVTVMFTVINEFDNFTLKGKIARIILSLATILIQIFTLFIIQRYFNVCVPTEKIPWCQRLSKLSYLEFSIKLALVIEIDLDDNKSTFTIIFALLLFCMTGFSAVYRYLYLVNYQKGVDFIQKLKDISLLLLFFISLLNYLIGSSRTSDLIYFLVFLPILLYLGTFLQKERAAQILYRLKMNELKNEAENEYALMFIMKLLDRAQGEGYEAQKAFGQIIDLMLGHIQDCSDEGCLCSEIDQLFEIIKLRLAHSSETFPLLKDEYSNFKKILDSQSMHGTFSQVNSHQYMKTQERNDNIPENQHLDQDGNTTLKKSGQHASRFVFKVNLPEVKKLFLSEVMNFYVLKLLQNMPSQINLRFLSSHFILYFKGREELSAFQLRRVLLNLSFSDKIQYTVNEQFILTSIKKVQKTKFDMAQMIADQKINGDYFIQLNKLEEKFNYHQECLTHVVEYFWLSFLKQELEILDTLNLGTQIAENTRLLHFYFTEIDRHRTTKDHHLYFKYAILQLHVLNDSISYEMYLNKMRAILEFNSLQQKGQGISGLFNEEDKANYVIVNSNEDHFGEILIINESLRQFLGWSKEDALRFKIQNMMPQLIKQKHNQFVRRFTKTGQSILLNKKSVIFVKKNNGFIVPVEIFFKFHYSFEYQYTFLLTAKPLTHMSPFNDGVRYPIKDLLFLILDNEIEGNVTEFSETWNGFLKKCCPHGSYELEVSGLQRRINDMLTDFDYSLFRQSASSQQQSNILEGIFQLDITEFKDTSIENKINKLRGNLSTYQGQPSQFNANVKVFHENYSGGTLKMSILCINVLNEQNKPQKIIQQQILSSQSSNEGLLKHSTSSTTDKNAEDSYQNIDQNEKNYQRAISSFQNMQGQYENHQPDMMNSESGSSQTFSTATATSVAVFRSLNFVTNVTTPRILSMIMRLIFILYVIMIAIATANMFINIDQQKQSEIEMSVLKNTYERMALVAQNQILLRTMINIANGYEPEDSEIISGRFTRYQQILENKLKHLQETNNALMKSQFKKSSEFKKFEDIPHLEISYLSDDNTPFIQYEKFNVALNLYVAKMNEVNYFNRSQLIGNTKVQTLFDAPPGTYSPTQNEKTLFFLIENGLRNIRRAIIDSNDFYARESEQHAHDSISTVLITAVISIASILGIGIFIMPYLTQVEGRRYEAISYFVKLPKEKIEELAKNAEYCSGMSETDRYQEIMLDYQKFLGLRLTKVKKEEGYRSMSSDGEFGSQHMGMKSTIGNSRVIQFGAQSSKKVSIGGKPQRATYRQTIDQDIEISPIGDIKDMLDEKRAEINDPTLSQVFKQITEPINDQNPSQMTFLQVGATTTRNIRLTKSQLASEILEKDESQSINSDQNPRAKVQSGKYTLANISSNSKDDGTDDQSNSQEPEEEPNDKPMGLDTKRMLKRATFKRLQDLIEKSMEEAERMKETQKFIMAQAFKRRVHLILILLSLISILASYFLIAFFLSMRTFDTSQKAVKSLELLFFQGSCFDQTLGLLKEDQIRNETVYVRDPRKRAFGNVLELHEGTAFYLDFCRDKEQQYRDLRISLPIYLEQIRGTLEALDSDQFCDWSYPAQQDENQICSQALDGVLKLGVQNTFSLMFSELLKQHLHFKQLAQIQKTRSITEYLKQEMQEKIIIEMEDAKLLIIDQALERLKDQSMDSVIEYLQGLLWDFLIAYIIFASILTFGIIIIQVYGFRNLRNLMLNTKIMLRIIPIETIEAEDRSQIREFLEN